MQLVVLGARFLKLADPLEVLFLVLEHLVKLLLSHAVFMPGRLDVGQATVTFLTNNSSDVLEVVKKYVTLLLLCGCTEKLRDFNHVLLLLLEVALGIKQGVVKVVILALLFRLEVERIKELKHALSELGDFNV